MDFHAYIRAHQDDLLRHLQEIIRIPSVEHLGEDGTPYGRAVHRCLMKTIFICEDLGFRPVCVDNRLGFCELGDGEEMVLVFGHTDVVPAGDGWTHDPFGGDIEDGRIYGRGAMDDKGPVIAALYALAAIRDSGLPLKRRLRVMFGSSEETGCADARYYMEHGGEFPVCGFTPDGEYPMINGEKGIINCSFSSRALQGTGDCRLLSLSGGTAVNVVPHAAMAVVTCTQDAIAEIKALPGITISPCEEGYCIDAQGVAAHGSTPEEGENAIGYLLHALAQLPFTGETKQALSFLSRALGTQTDGSGLGIHCTDAVSGALTLNLGVISLAADMMTVSMSIRYPVTATLSQIEPSLRQSFASGGFTEHGWTHFAPCYMPPESELVQTLCKVYERETGEKATLKSIGGGTYAKFIPNIVAFGPIFPGDEVREHKADEYMVIEQLLRHAEITAAAMYELAK